MNSYITYAHNSIECVQIIYHETHPPLRIAAGGGATASVSPSAPLFEEES